MRFRAIRAKFANDRQENCRQDLDHVGVGREHAVRKPGVDLQSGVLDELRLE